MRPRLGETLGGEKPHSSVHCSDCDCPCPASPALRPVRASSWWVLGAVVSYGVLLSGVERSNLSHVLFPTVFWWAGLIHLQCDLSCRPTGLLRVCSGPAALHSLSPLTPQLACLQINLATPSMLSPSLGGHPTNLGVCWAHLHPETASQAAACGVAPGGTGQRLPHLSGRLLSFSL